jgi:hypothetical protein
MTEARVAGVDLSLTKAGLARVDGTLATLRPHGAGYERHRSLATKISRELYAMRPLELVVLEGYDPHPLGYLALVRAAEIGGIVRSWLTAVGFIFEDVAPAALKKRATGKGNANKAAVVAAARAAGAPIETDDEADAYWLRQIGLERLGACSPTAS